MLLGVGVILFTFYFNSFCPTAGVFSVEPRVVNIEFFKLGICIKKRILKNFLPVTLSSN